MIPKGTVLRVARPTDHLGAITQQYIDGLGFTLLGEFQDHQGFDGAIIGHPHQPWHLEFTQHKGTVAGKAPTQDNLLVFYLPEPAPWQASCNQVLQAGFKQMPAFNTYWDAAGKTFEDIDGYRVVLQQRAWVT